MFRFLGICYKADNVAPISRPSTTRQGEVEGRSSMARI